MSGTLEALDLFREFEQSVEAMELAGIVYGNMAMSFEDLPVSERSHSDIDWDLFIRRDSETSHRLAPKKIMALGAAGVVALTTGLPHGAVSAQEAGPVSPSGNIPAPSLVYIGDSISVGTENPGEIVSRFRSAGVDVTYDAVGSRPLVFGACESNPQGNNCQRIGDGIRALEAHRDEVERADVVVLALGTNDWSNVIAENATRVIRRAHEIGSADGRAPTIVVPEMFYTSDYAGGATDKNRVLSEIEAALTAEGIDLRVLANYTEQGFALADGIHPEWSSYDELAAFSVQQIAPIVQESHMRHYTLSPSTDVTGQDPYIVDGSQTEAPDTEDNGLLGNILDGFEQITGVFDNNRSVPQFDVDVSQVLAEETTDLTALYGQVESLLDSSVEVPAQNTELSVGSTNLPAEPATAESISASGINILSSQDIIADDALSTGGNIRPIDVGSIISSLDPTELQPLSDIGNTSNAELEQLAASVDVPQVTTIDLGVSGGGESIGGLNSLYSIGANGEVEMSGLVAHIEDTFQRADPNDGRYPAGAVRFPDQIAGMPYEWHESVTDAERFMSPRMAAVTIMAINKYKELQAKYPDLLGINWQIGDAISNHREHSHGGDVDYLLLPNEEANREMFMFFVSLKEPSGQDGLFNHIVTGDRNLETVGEDYVTSAGLEDPNIIYQADHGRSAQGYNHWHVSIDGGSDGPYELEYSSVALNDTRPVNLVGGNLAAITAVGGIGGTTSVETPAYSIDINSLDIDFNALLAPARGNVQPASPQGPDLQSTEQPQINSLVDLSVFDNLAAIDHQQIQGPVDVEILPTEPEVAPEPEAATQSNGRYNVEAPLLDVFTPEVVQAILPDAPIENIINYTPLILNGLRRFGIADPQMACFSFATIRAETSAFAPIEEHGRGQGRYYGEVDPETGFAYYGRGFIQLTLKANYIDAGNDLGYDLLNNPELALNPPISGDIMGWFNSMHEPDIRSALNAGDLRRARQVVNGEAAHGYNTFRQGMQTCQSLLDI